MKAGIIYLASRGHLPLPQGRLHPGQPLLWGLPSLSLSVILVLLVLPLIPKILVLVQSLPTCLCSYRLSYFPAMCYERTSPQFQCPFAGLPAIQVTVRHGGVHRRDCFGKSPVSKVCVTPTTHWGYSNGGGHQDFNQQQEVARVKEVLKDLGENFSQITT